MTSPAADDEPYPFEDYKQFKKEALRLNKLSQKGKEFLALLGQFVQAKCLLLELFIVLERVRFVISVGGRHCDDAACLCCADIYKVPPILAGRVFARAK